MTTGSVGQTAQFWWNDNDINNSVMWVLKRVKTGKYKAFETNLRIE